ncbi:hypothetical protein ERJ75_001813100 [Trypanosoma vivax]|nr:hypothetical protein ERJ75_001813100 [Trypanosoma vivax]
MNRDRGKRRASLRFLHADERRGGAPFFGRLGDRRGAAGGLGGGRRVLALRFGGGGRRRISGPASARHSPADSVRKVLPTGRVRSAARRRCGRWRAGRPRALRVGGARWGDEGGGASLRESVDGAPFARVLAWVGESDRALRKRIFERRRFIVVFWLRFGEGEKAWLKLARKNAVASAFWQQRKAALEPKG